MPFQKQHCFYQRTCNPKVLIFSYSCLLIFFQAFALLNYEKPPLPSLLAFNHSFFIHSLTNRTASCISPCISRTTITIVLEKPLLSKAPIAPVYMDLLILQHFKQTLISSTLCSRDCEGKDRSSELRVFTCKSKGR